MEVKKKVKRTIEFVFVLVVCQVVFLVICSPVGADKANLRQGQLDRNSLAPDSFESGSLEPGSLESGIPNQGITDNKPFDGFLYFADAGGDHLKAIFKRFASNLNRHELGRNILEALMAGPANSALAPTFPADTQVRALFISDGRAWVDLGIPGGRLKNMDTVSELLAIYSLVNSLTLNIPGVKQVKLLVNGSDVDTLGGHVSLKYFYKTNMLIVK